MDLGRENKDMPAMAVGQSEAPKTVYPSFEVRDETMDAFIKEHGDIERDDEGAATIRWRCSGSADTQYGKHLDFEIIELNDLKKGKAEGGEGAEEEAGGDRETPEYPNPAVRKLMAGKKR